MKVLTTAGLTKLIELIKNTFLDKTDTIDVSEALSIVAITGSYSDLSNKPTNMVTTDTDQDITGTKTFIGEKKIKFKQSASGNKLGFTLYDNDNKEAAAFEYRPNTINSYPLMYLGQYIGSGGVSYVSTPIYVGFRCYDNAYNASYNLVAPLAKDARSSFSLDRNYKTFYLPLGITDGNTTVTTGSNGVLDISSLLSGGGGSYTAGTGIDITNDVISAKIATSVSSSSTNADAVGAKLFYDTCGDIETLINAL